MDTDLRMHSALEQLLSKVSAEVTAILRTRAYYIVPELITSLKTHVWGLIESNSGGYFHAATSLSVGLDHAQNRFIRGTGPHSRASFLGIQFCLAEPEKEYQCTWLTA